MTKFINTNKYIHRIVPIYFEIYPPSLQNKRDLIHALDEGFEIIRTDKIEERLIYILRKEVPNDDQ